MPSDEVLRELKDRIRKLEEELKLAKQESLVANRKKTLFLANMSHEIRTPMNSILGIYSLFSETNLSDEQKDFLEIIHIASQNLLTIINDILDLSKIEAGQLTLEESPFSPPEEIHQVIKLLSLKAKGKGIDLYSNIEASVPECVIGDAVRLKQILINLTNNALKYTHEGEVQIAVEMIQPDNPEFGKQSFYLPDWIEPGDIQPNQCVLKFSVVDTGIGISSEEQETLFHEFTQVKNPLIQRFEGTGLGLSISRDLTRLMKGKMGVISEKDKGSAFWFTLLFTIGDQAMLEKQGETKTPRSVRTRPLKVLLVEDNLLNQKFAMTTLKREGHAVDVAENGKVALEKFRHAPFDLILMDIAMPVMDGLEASRKIREVELERLKKMSEKEAESFSPVKIVAITAHIMVTDREKCIRAGMNDYLAKPYRPADLNRIIDHLDIR